MAWEAVRSLLQQTRLSLLTQTPSPTNRESHASSRATIGKRDNGVMFISGCILAKEEHCLIAGRIHTHSLPDHCLVALGMISNCQYLQNQALNNSQASSRSPRMSHAP